MNNKLTRYWRYGYSPLSLLLCGLPLLLTGCGGGGHDSTSSSSRTYSITDLGVLPGGTSSSAAALNNKGQIVGLSGSGSSSHAFLWQSNQIADLGTPPGGSFSQATGINDSGQICGTFGSGTKDSQGLALPHAFLYNAGAFTDLGVLAGDATSGASAISTDGTVAGYSIPSFIFSPNTIGPGPSHAALFRAGSVVGLGTLPGDTASLASGINSLGQVVGDSYVPGKNVRHAFIYSNAALTALGALAGDIGSSASAINTGSQAVGFSLTDAGPGVQGREISHSRAVLFTGGQVTNLGLLPGDTDSAAVAINDTGQVVGISENTASSDPAQIKHPFVWQQGQMADLNSRLPAGSGWVLTDATGINNAGQICGTGEHNGQTHAFLLTSE